MAKDNTILNLMIDHHALIEVYLSIVQNKLDEKPETVKEAFDNFKWQLEKHFFFEERSIFPSYKAGNVKIVGLIEEIISEHIMILQKTVALQEQLNKGEAIEVSDLQKTVTVHREKEEKELYPLLDEEFTPYQKETTAKKIGAIVMQRTF